MTDRLNRSSGAIALSAVWLAACVFSLSSYSLTNDQFDRISRGAQIARYGELPFRDFHDPGYIGAEFALAGLQLLIGDNLLADWLLTSAAMAIGIVAVLCLSLRVSGSLPLALVVAVVGLFSFPRAYDYDKVLFYPLGMLLCWRYLDRGRYQDLWVLAAGIVGGALFRYDTGVYLGCAALTAIVVCHSGRWTNAARHVASFALAVCGLALPFVLTIGFAAGFLTVPDQLLTYGFRESARTRFDTAPEVSIETLVGLGSRERQTTISVRWAPSIDRARRAELESAYRLQNAVPDNENDRTWLYVVGDDSEANVSALITDPAIEDTSGLDRLGGTLRSAPLLRVDRTGWHASLRAWNGTRANAFLYHFLRWLPVVAAFVLVLRSASRTSPSPVEVAGVSGLIVMCLLLGLFILRDPVYARVGGMAGPPCVLATWIVRQISYARSAIVRLVSWAGVVTIFAVTMGSLAVATEWYKQPMPRLTGPEGLQARAVAFAGSPPSLSELPNSELAGLVSYLRECTARRDRILLTWFAPEIYFFSQRGFAAGLPTIFSDHWSEDRFQTKSVQIWQSQSVPIVITDADRAFGATHPALARYLDNHYRLAGMTNFGSKEESGPRYGVYVQRDRVPRSVHQRSSLPCF